MAEFTIKGGWRTYLVLRDGKEVAGPFAQLWQAEEAVTRLERKERQRERSCMCCKAVFTSEGAHNRLCATCRTKSNDTDWMI